MKTYQHHGGFTLIEVAVAVGLLGIALTTLIGLQTAYADRYLYERNLTRAALYAQYLLTVMEIDPNLPDDGNSDQDLASALSDGGYFEDEAGEAVQQERDELSSWKVIRQVEKISIDPIEDAMRRVDLTIRWSDAALDRFSIVYYIRGQATVQR